MIDKFKNVLKLIKEYLRVIAGKARNKELR